MAVSGEIETLLASFNRVVASGTPGIDASIRLFRHRQVLSGKRAAQGTGSAARLVCLWQV